VTVESFIFGYSPLNLPILAHRFGKRIRKPHVLILGGVHGDEPEGVVAANGLIARWLQDYPFLIQSTIVPTFNAEGVLNKNRLNSRGVDLNRNLPTKDWSPEIATPRYNPGPFAASEPENQALIKFLEQEKPQFILSLHSWKPILNTNGDCEKIARAIASFVPYEVSPTIGYSTPGCLGTYAGLERNIPTLTYEIERGLTFDLILRDHLPAIEAGLKTLEQP
jgi:protein MpaA